MTGGSVEMAKVKWVLSALTGRDSKVRPVQAPDETNGAIVSRQGVGRVNCVLIVSVCWCTVLGVLRVN